MENRRSGEGENGSREALAKQGVVMILRMCFMMACLLACIAAGPALASDTPEDAAQNTAELWLKLVDDGQYAASWEQAARVFKGVVKQADWEHMAGGVRTPLGKLVSRQLRSREYTEKMPGAPDGKYVIIQYDTVFENKASAVETVTPMVDPDGSWRVSGYFIR
jgi:hypothetical protein